MIGRAIDAPSWVLERWRASATALHRRPIPADGRRRLSLMEPRTAAVVLGSTSPSVEFAADWGGVSLEVARRRSGGGLVWLDPANSVWLDVMVPVDDVLHERDIGRSFLWLGDLVGAAARSLGIDATVHRGRHQPGPDDGLLCFEGVGAGEVLVGDRKLVGISQRRTRAGSRFQLVWYETWELGALDQVLSDRRVIHARGAGIGTRELGVGAGPEGLLGAVGRLLGVSF